jgi:hypothetical protein
VLNSTNSYIIFYSKLSCFSYIKRWIINLYVLGLVRSSQCFFLNSTIDAFKTSTNFWKKYQNWWHLTLNLDIMFGEFHRCKGPMRATKIEPIYVSSCSTPVYICARSLWGSRNANFGDSILSILQQSRKEELVSCKAISQLKKGIALRKSSTNR